jgi:hypothetical protein
MTPISPIHRFVTNFFIIFRLSSDKRLEAPTMGEYRLRKIYQILSISWALLNYGCIDSDVASVGRDYQSYNSECSTGLNCSNGETYSSMGIGAVPPPVVEIRHLIEPNLSTDTTYSTGIGKKPSGGSYVRKLTLPKNFAGRLYLAGINVGTLSSTHVKVRFNFGLNREPITIPAFVSKAPGITPQTDISVLVMDLRSEPFRNIRLPYDLFDYNEYDSGTDPTEDNRNTNLYCRGLKIEDDPTFNGKEACDSVNEECLYAYAKVVDQGLIKESVPLTPSFPQVKSTGGGGYYKDSMAYKILKPLQDSIPVNNIKFSELDVSSGSSSIILTNPGNIWDPIPILGTNYYYRGPYRLINRSNWEFKLSFGDLHGKNRLFKENSFIPYPIYLEDPLLGDNSNPEQERLYFKSYLFPLATKLNLAANKSYLPQDQITEKILSVSGKTELMDGSNARAQSRNYDQEHVGSCNVTATIEIIAKDKNNISYVIASSKDVKLQIVRPTQYSTDLGNEVLYSNYKSCTSDAGCSSNECCLNNRCWDQNLVSNCIDNRSQQGNRDIGDQCASDLECSTLCCNPNSATCSPHNTSVTPAFLCSKPMGDYCIAKEWCQKSTVVKCYVIKTGIDNLGNVTCRQQCYNVEEFGDCKNGICIPPFQAAIPSFDPSLQNACDNAVPAPYF